MKYLTEQQLFKVGELIQDELTKRGFHHKIIRLEEAEVNQFHNGNSIKLETENFNTTPVIYKSCQVANFSTSVGESNEFPDSKEKVVKVWIVMCVVVKLFEGGGNSVKLFDFDATFAGDRERPIRVQIK